MQFVVSHWVLWLILLVVFIACALCNQVRVIKNVAKKDFNFVNPMKNFFPGMWLTVVAWLLSLASGVLLLIAIIINVANYIKG